MGVNSLPKTIIRQRRDCDLNPGPFAPESSTLTTRLWRKGKRAAKWVYECDESTIVAEGLNAEGARRSAGGTVISPYSRAEDPSFEF